MRVRRAAGNGESERTLRLCSNETLGTWFRLPQFVTDDGELMDALREALSRRIGMTVTFWGPVLIGLEDVWSWLFYGRSWLDRQVRTALEASWPRRAV